MYALWSNVSKCDWPITIIVLDIRNESDDAAASSAKWSPMSEATLISFICFLELFIIGYTPDFAPTEVIDRKRSHVVDKSEASSSLLGSSALWTTHYTANCTATAWNDRHFYIKSDAEDITVSPAKAAAMVSNRGRFSWSSLQSYCYRQCLRWFSGPYHSTVKSL